MPPIGSVVPELNSVWNEDEASPVWWTRHVATLETGFELGKPTLESSLIVKFTALHGSPGAELTAARSGGEVGIGLSRTEPGNDAFNTNLPLEWLPVKAHGSHRVTGEFLPLSSFVVGEEAKALLINAFDEEHAHSRPPAFAQGSQGKGERFRKQIAIQRFGFGKKRS